MKKFLFILFALLVSLAGKAQDPSDEVTLEVIGYGNSIEVATNNALQNAINQAYRAFVSANTQMPKDKLIQDEIAPDSIGNVKNYKDIVAIDMPNGKKEVIVKATISIPKLIDYAESNGKSTEFTGALFARNIKIRELNEANERKIMDAIFKYISLSLPSCYERKLTISEPIMFYDEDKEYVNIPMTINFIPNDNLKICSDNVNKILESIYLTDKELNEYDKLRIESYICDFQPSYDKYSHICGIGSNPSRLRNSYSSTENRLKIDSIFDNYFNDISIIDNTNEVSELKLRRYKDEINVLDIKTRCIKRTGLFKKTNNSLDNYGDFEGHVDGYGTIFGIVFSEIPGAEFYYSGYGGHDTLLVHWVCYTNEPSATRQPEYFHPSFSFSILIPKEDIGKYSSFKLLDK